MAVEEFYEKKGLKRTLSPRPDSPIVSIFRTLSKGFANRETRLPRCLCVLLCYNEADVLEDLINHMLTNHHDIVVWDHGSNDGTAEILDKYENRMIERSFVPRSVSFYTMYQAMSRHIIDEYVDQYDWVSWPDADEFLEGPARDKTYYEYICDVFNSKYDYIRFNNYNFWFTSEDDVSIPSPVKRIHRYSLFPDCAPRIRSWRADRTNIRIFNHNPVKGKKYPVNFNLRHYPMRTYEQMIRRLSKERANLQKGGQNYHYNNLLKNSGRLRIEPEKLHYDNGVADLQSRVIFYWKEIYG